MRLGPEDALVIRSHGVTPEIFERIMKTGAKIIDATCPYVASIQRKARKYYEEGYQIVIVGDPNHPEVIGINGCCNNTAIITRNGDELNNLPDRVCILSQTTERQSNFEKTREIVSKKCKDMLAFNTICSATRERQDSAEQISKTVDLMIVIGGRHSSNTKKLYEVCSANCKTLLIENKQELPDWVRTDLQLERIGVTAGASTPDWIIDEIVDIISLIADDRVIQEESD
jgi:(E)-4-hydroxy-3-methyl-but-2-enyl pyrophosphate reductase